MAKKILTCLMTQVVAMAVPVADELKETFVDPVRDAYYAATGYRHTERPALLELFAGSAHMTIEFAKKGYNVLEPRDILYGHNLFDRSQQESVLYDIETLKPRLLWVALPCTEWCPWQRINYAHRKQVLRRKRKIQKHLVRFALECVDIQFAHGGEVIFEHPKDSDLWRDDDMLTNLTRDWWTPVDLDMCRYNLRAQTDGGLHKKPTRLMVSDDSMAAVLKKNCRGDHEHTPTAGRNTKAAGIYTKEFCEAVIRAYRRRDGLWGAEGDKTWEAFAASASSKPLEVREEEVGGASGVYLPDHIPKHITKALRRIHQNLGHPSNKDLARHLKLSGATEEAMKAAEQIHCETCSRLKGPGTRRPAKVVRALDFNEEVCLDTLVLYDQEGTRVETLSILDTRQEVTRHAQVLCGRLGDVGWASYDTDGGPGEGVHQGVRGPTGRAGHHHQVHCRTSSLATRSCGKTRRMVQVNLG